MQTHPDRKLDKMLDVNLVSPCLANSYTVSLIVDVLVDDKLNIRKQFQTEKIPKFHEHFLRAIIETAAQDLC